MDTKTLIDVVARIDAMMEYCYYTAASEDWIEDYRNGYKDSLKELREYLQKGIDAEVAAMETNMGM